MNLRPSQFQKIILSWFDKHGRKHLPWQHNKTPYRVWISEIMLQQTQVSTVIPYFEKFMRDFPDVQSLAKATEDEVLHHWAGLGYYSRARNLHRAAKMIIDEFNGIFPNDTVGLLQLPGIGTSTAGAILSIAFNHPAPILDGNVKRVLARLHSITKPINDKAVENELWRLATLYTPKKRTADYTQAMMDLGATLCIRGKPGCERCPLATHCQGHVLGIAATLPTKKAARSLPVRIATFLILQNNGRVLLLKRPPTGIWGGLWSLPEIVGEPTLVEIQAHCQQLLKLNVTAYQPMDAFRHTFSHYHLDIHPVIIQVKRKLPNIMEDNRQIWYNPSEPQAVGLPKPIQTIMRDLR